MDELQEDVHLRLAREREFNNDRFEADGRADQVKYYAALKACDADMAAEVMARSAGRDVLDYGCATGDWAVTVAGTARRVVAIDLSDVAIGKARQRAHAAGTANAEFAVADAMATGMAAASFDLIYGSGIIHHLDTDRSMREIHRLLRPGGSALFKEPLGHNWLINGYRRLTPDARTADEHPLLRRDIAIARRYFDVSVRFYGLATMAVVPFRGRRVEGPVYVALECADRVLLRLKGLRWLAWYVLLDLRKAGPAQG